MNPELIGQLAQDKLNQLRTQAAIEQSLAPELRSRQHSLRQGNLLAPAKHKLRQVALSRRRNP